MTAADQAHAIFARLIALQDDNDRLQVQRNTLSDALGQVLDENGRLRQALGLDVARPDSKPQ